MGEQILTYTLGQKLYLNVTNRCTNNCLFCIRHTPGGIGYNLWLEREPSVEEVIRAIKDPLAYREVVFCGYGEPLMRLELVREVASWLKKRGAAVRINTNGQANLLYGQNIVPALKGLVDAMSISLNAHAEDVYRKVCRPVFGEKAYGAVLEFARACVGEIPKVVLTAVEWPEVDMQKCREIAHGLGAEFRPRHFVGG